ncbi:MAG: hypothetical protein R3330_14705, partial [Saprospiraceae bacterium]|nr:hypothetical protein [Saprospiraceae bacterium]
MKPITFIKLALMGLCMTGILLGCDKESVVVKPDPAPGTGDSYDVDNTTPTYYGHDDAPVAEGVDAIIAELNVTLAYTPDEPGALINFLEIGGAGRANTL